VLTQMMGAGEKSSESRRGCVRSKEYANGEKGKERGVKKEDQIQRQESYSVCKPAKAT
jgi:hypothetical protein